VKTQFLANMSHEVRTPLNGLLGFLELAREMASNPEQREYLEIVNERARFLLGILEDVLSIAKIESKAVPLDLGCANVADILRSVERLWLGPAQRKNLQLEVIWDEAVARPLWTDAYKLEQILNNLLSNAVKFTQAGCIRVEATAGDGEDGLVDLCVRVRDTGIGIPRALQETIFHPFTQVDSSTTRDFGGTGLGLSISRSLAYMLGGDLTVASEPGRGSLFTLRIAASRNAPAETRKPARAAATPA
jgi:signal transduction histidine kinase